MYSLNTLKKNTIAPVFGFAIDTDMAQAMSENPAHFPNGNPTTKSGDEVIKWNIPYSAAPAVTVAKDYDVSKPSFIGVDVSSDEKYINLRLTNEKPLNDVEKNNDIMAVIGTRYDDPNDEAIREKARKAIIALKKPAKK